MSNIFCIGNTCYNMEFIKYITCNDQVCFIEGTKYSFNYIQKNDPTGYNQAKKYFNLLKKKSS